MALTVLAVICGGVTLAFGTSLQAGAAIRQRADAADERRVLTERLRADLEGVWLRPGSQTTWFRGIDGGSESGGSSTPEEDALELTTARPVSLDAVRADEGPAGAAGPQSDVAQVSWRLELGADGAMELVRRERTPPDPDVDDTDDPAVTRIVVARGLTGVNLRFFDGTDWQDAWDAAGGDDASAATNAPGLPRAVEVTLFLAGGRPRAPRQSEPATSPEETPQMRVVVSLPDPTGMRE